MTDTKTDIVIRLHAAAQLFVEFGDNSLSLPREAAQEIERLRAENEQLKIALSDSPRDDGTYIHRLDAREGDQ